MRTTSPRRCADVEQQRQREARLGANRMMRLELRDLVFRPRVESVALDRAQLDVCCRVRARSISISILLSTSILNILCSARSKKYERLRRVK
jgi:hypothetical protein